MHTRAVTGLQFTGVLFVLLGSLHFHHRDRQPEERSVLGAIIPGSWARTAFAVAEVAFGFVLLFLGR